MNFTAPKNVWFYTTLLLTGFMSGTLLYLFSPYLDSLKADFLRSDPPPIFIKNGKTYVAFPYPPIQLTIVTSKNCKGLICDLNGSFYEIKKQLSPAILATAYDADSDAGKQIVQKYQIKSLPAFLFDRTVEYIPHFFEKRQDFVEAGDRYLLKVPAGYLLEQQQEGGIGSGTTELIQNSKSKNP